MGQATGERGSSIPSRLRPLSTGTTGGSQRGELDSSWRDPRETAHSAGTLVDAQAVSHDTSPDTARPVAATPEPQPREEAGCRTGSGAHEGLASGMAAASVPVREASPNTRTKMGRTRVWGKGPRA